MNHSDDPRQSTLTRLGSWLGRPFVAWVLNGPSDPPTPAQQEVARFLEARITAGLAEHPDWPPDNALAPLKGIDPNTGTTYLNGLRTHAGGDIPAPPPATGDNLHDSLSAIACEAYGELLLRTELFNSLMSPYTSHHGRRVVELVQSDPTFPFSQIGRDDSSSVQVLRSTGSGGGLQVYGVAPSLVQAAWDVAQLDHEVPTPQQVLEALSPLLQQARLAFQGKPATVTALASMTGLVLPDHTVIDLGWGRLRAAAPRHHPDFVGTSHTQSRTTRRLDDGSEVAVSDAGEVLLEARLPYEVRVIEEFDLSDEDEWPTLRSRDELNDRIAQVQLAHLLAWQEDQVPALVLAWNRFIEPVTQGFSVGLADPSLYANRVPTRLSSDQLASWVEWIRRLDNVPLTKLGVAPRRLIRASTERRDPYDALIDAVIAWESMFAADTEAVLRVSAAMARLLHGPGQDRAAAKTRVASIYRLRSKIVHGNEVDLKEAYDASRDAVRLTIDTTRSLILHRPDLVRLTGAERSTRLLLE